jgi:uncharacterized Rmd1/YagE family protein
MLHDDAVVCALPKVLRGFDGGGWHLVAWRRVHACSQAWMTGSRARACSRRRTEPCHVLAVVYKAIEKVTTLCTLPKQAANQMFRACLQSASRLHAARPVARSNLFNARSLLQTARASTSALPAGSNSNSNVNNHPGKGKPSAKSLKKAGSYGPNVKTQLRQDRSSIIRHTVPDGQAISFSTAERYDIDTLRKSLWDHKLLGRGDGFDAMNLMGEAIWIPKWPVEDSSNTSSSIATNNGNESENSSVPKKQSDDTPGEIFIFETGSFVSWHMSAADAQAFADEVLKKSDVPVEIEPYAEPQVEAMGFVVQSGEKTGVKEDMIVIGTTSEALQEEDDLVRQTQASPPLATAIDPLPNASKGAFSLSSSSPSASQAGWAGPFALRQTILPRSEDDLRARLSLSSGLARSTKLAVYEEMLDSHMDE